MDAELNLQKIYDMYVDWCRENEVKPVKFNIHRKVFKEDVNIGFGLPKNHQRDTCEMYDVVIKNNAVQESLLATYNKHVSRKVATQMEHQTYQDSKNAVLSFDLQNVILVPQANVSNMLYKRTLNVYNLTSHKSTTRQAYCVVWHEMQAGSSGNDIATALIAMLD